MLLFNKTGSSVPHNIVHKITNSLTWGFPSSFIVGIMKLLKISIRNFNKIYVMVYGIFGNDSWRPYVNQASFCNNMA
jgi:hypothetical protein